MSQSLARADTTARSPLHPSRISLIDNTVPKPPPSTDSQPDDNEPQSCRPKDGHIESIRRAIAEHRYKRWSLAPGLTNIESDGAIEVPDERAMGMLSSRDSGCEGTSANGSGSPAMGDAADDTYRQGRVEDGAVRSVGKEAGDTGQKRAGRAKEIEIGEIDVLYENQRGSFICGIPLFSSKSLLNFDPSAWQNGLFHNSAVSIVNAQLPDPSWVWGWKSWYVDMTSDVDEEGWMYSFSFSPAFAWHGNHIWFHSFVRRRRWLRKRVKLPTRTTRDGVKGDGSSLTDTIGRAGHGLNNDYFTIHSRKDRSSWNAAGSQDRPSVIQGSDWGGEDDSDEEVEFKDVGTLMKVVKKARLDREKIEAVMKFVEQGGDDVVYLADKMDTLMGCMVFQASRRQLLSHLLEYTDQYEAGEAPTITIIGAPSPPLDSELSRPSSPASSEPLTSPTPKVTVVEGRPASKDTPKERRKKIESLRKASRAADDEVKKMEFWSDIKGVARKGESLTAEDTEHGWGNLGISGASMGNEKIFGGAGQGRVSQECERVDMKGKGKRVMR